EKLAAARAKLADGQTKAFKDSLKFADVEANARLKKLADTPAGREYAQKLMKTYPTGAAAARARGRAAELADQAMKAKIRAAAKKAYDSRDYAKAISIASSLPDDAKMRQIVRDMRARMGARSDLAKEGLEKLAADERAARAMLTDLRMAERKDPRELYKLHEDRKERAAVLERMRAGASGDRARAAKLAAVAKKAYEELDYAKALDLAERAAAADPENAEAKKLAQRTRSLLGTRPDWARYGLKELSREKKVQIQQNLFRLERSLADGRKLAERAGKDRPGDDERPAEERLSRRIRDLNGAIEQFKHVGEITKWMPYRLDLTSREKETKKLLADALARREEAAEELRVERRRKATQAAMQRGSLDPEVPRERLQQMMAMARIQHDRGKFEEAEEIASAIIKEDPTDKDAAALLALSRLKRHERAEAELYAKRGQERRTAWHIVEEAAIPYDSPVAVTQQKALQVAKGKEGAAVRQRIRMERELNRRRGGPSPRELAARKLIAGTQRKRETVAPRAPSEPGGEVDEIARKLDEAYGRITGQRKETGTAALDRKSAKQRSRYLKEMGERLYGEMQYVRAREMLQRAVALDPTNKEAAQRLAKVDDLLDVRMPEIRTSLEMLAKEKQVTIQENLVGLENSLRRAAESVERSGTRSSSRGASATGVTALAERIRNADRAVRYAEQAREIIKWMPSEVNTAEQKRRAEELLADARNRRAKALAELRNKKASESITRLQRGTLEEQKDGSWTSIRGIAVPGSCGVSRASRSTSSAGPPSAGAARRRSSPSTRGLPMLAFRTRSSSSIRWTGTRSPGAPRTSSS
ncbi:MAG: hypothetical protein ACYSU0_14780, partial [Planctomycetota bacterium]